MPVNGRRKGARGELEFVAWLKHMFGFGGRRSQQYCGTAGDADVTTELDHILFIDVKRVETLQLSPALAQVQRDAASTTRIPVVMHKKNRGPWIAVLAAHDLIQLVRYHPLCPTDPACPMCPPPEQGTP